MRMATSQSTPLQRDSPLTQWWDMYEQAQESASDHRVDVFVRSITPTLGEHTRRQHRLEALEEAAELEAIDTYDVTVLGDEICLCERCTTTHRNESRAELVDTLRRWEFEGLDASGFVDRTVSSSVTGETYRAIVPPDVSFGIYLDDSLVGVFPCGDEERTYGLETYLDGIGAHRENRRR